MELILEIDSWALLKFKNSGSGFGHKAGEGGRREHFLKTKSIICQSVVPVLEGMVAAPWLKAATTSSRNDSTGYTEEDGPRYCGEKECGIECPADRWCANTGSCDVVDSIQN